MLHAQRNNDDNRWPTVWYSCLFPVRSRGRHLPDAFDSEPWILGKRGSTTTTMTTRSSLYLYSEHRLRAEYLELFLGVGVVVSLVSLEGRLLLRQRRRLFVEAGVDDVGAFLFSCHRYRQRRGFSGVVLQGAGMAR